MAASTSSTSSTSGSSGSDTLTASSDGSKISAGAGDDTVYGGAGSDTLNGDAGNDTLVYNISQNVATQDTYTGGSGIDTLLIQFTLQQWLMTGYQAQIAAYLAHLAAYTNQVTKEVSNGTASDFTFQFGTSTLKVQMVEKLAVTVDGASVDPVNAACTAVADAATISEDSGPVTVNVLANDIVPDLVKDLALGTGPSHGVATLVKPNVSNPSTWYFQYQANNAYFQSLAVGETGTDSFTCFVTDADGDVSSSTVTVTVTGSNDGPFITAASASGSVTEDAAAITLHDSGAITFDDLDLSDAHTTSVQPAAGNLLGGSLTAAVTTAATGAGAGTVTWNYNVANSATQYLAAGQTVVEQFVVTVSDGHGGTATQTVSVTVTGTNDAPTVSSAVATGSLVEDATLPTLATSGTIAFDDLDLTDTHTTSVSAGSGNTLGGSLTANITDTATGAGDGTVSWNYSVANSATQYLAQGETATETFTVTIADNHGGSVNQVVTITVTGTNDGPQLGVADGAGSVTEDAGSPTLSDSGTIAFDDVDLIDTHTTSVTTDAGNKLGGSLTAAVTDVATGAGDGTVKWDYSVANSATQYLAAGETTTESFVVKVSDNHGGFVNEGVTVTVTGVNDGPTVSAADAAGAVTEDATTPNLTDTGALTFDDVDLIDTHTTSVATDAGNQLGGNLTAGVTDPATGAGNGTVTWNYSVANSATQYLAEGETTTENFTVKVSDNHGGFVNQGVTVTVTGVNDGPTISVADTAGAVTEDAATPNLTDTGTITFDDVDLIDTHTTSVATDAGNKLGGNLTASVTDTATGATDGTVTWDYSIANSATQYLAEGETTTENFTVKVSDNHGGFVDQGVTVTLTGVNDGPTISAADAAGAVTEDATTPNLTGTGAITFDDVDLIDTHSTSVATDAGNKLGGNLTAGVTDVATGAGDGTVTWDYNVANSATQYLAEGETTTENFTVKVSDNHGGFVNQGVTVTLTGVNDAPTVSAADGSGAVTEDASTPNLTDTGAITFDDVDLIDTHTTSVATDSGNKLGGNLTAGVTDTATGATDGTVTWDYSVANSATQYLAEGETTTENFTVKVSDNHGGFVNQGVTVTVTGVNDGPTISAADGAGAVTEDAATPNLTDTGAITFDDVDLIDTHTTSVATDAGNKLGGNLTASVTDTATGATDGTVTWDYSVANSATQYLAEGETTTENFTVKVSDNHGGFANQGVTVTVTGVNDGPTISAADSSGAVTEDASTPNLTGTGAITFDDADLVDTHTTSVATDAGNKLGGNLTASVTDTATGATDGTVTWDYNVANSATQYLAEGEKTTESFTIKVSDNHGGFVDQGVTVTVTGVNDGPTISAADGAGAVTEDAATPNLTDTGAITFDDVDLIDTHTTSVATDSGNKLGGNLTAGVTDVATGAGNGTVTWNYSVANSATQYLAEGETTTENFTVKVSDNHGGFVNQGVTVTVTGVNDGPTISTADGSGAVTEDASAPNLTDTGAITFDDVDLIDTHTTSVSTDAGNKLGGNLTASVTDTATGATDGTVTWDYNVANSATQYLAEGETTTENFTVKVSDNHGGFVDQGVTVTVTGVNDGPTISAADAAGAVTEDATTPNLTDTGAITFDDVDLIDTHSTSVATDAGNKLGGNLTAGVTDVATGAGNGTVTWDYSVANSATQYLAEGETTTENFTIKVSDNHGGFVDQGVTVTVTGVNDGPTISAADDSGAVTEDASTPNLTDTGAITFDDVDLIDTHTTSVATDSGNKLGGNLTASVTDTATGATDGTVTWDYSVANAATQYLAEGETTKENFTVKVADNNGGFVNQGVTVTVTGVNDGPTISAADGSGAVTEDASTPNLTDTGAITFDDVDLIDTHTTSVATDSGNKLGGNLTAGVTDPATGAGDGTVTWNYSVANSATQYLAEDETTTENFTVKVSDNHGGFVNQGVTVTVTGVNDGPTISAADGAGAVTEDATTPNLTDTGAITFDDADLIDTHTTSVATDAGNKLGGNLTASVTDTATGATDGTVTWDYSVANSATQYLAKGETTTENFTVKVNDNHGGFVDQGVTVTVTGVNDGPTISAADDSGAVTEDASTPNLTDTGAITFDDVDLIDTHTTSVATDSGNKLGGNLTASVTDTATGATDGTVTWNYTVANSATQYLAQGETTTENFTVKVSDNNGGFVNQGVTVTVTGVNDGPTVSAADAGSVTEDASTPNLTDTGAITFDDADLIDTHTTSVATDAGNKLGGNLTAAVTDVATGAGDGTVTWNYTVANSATQYLAQGETTKENFTVKVTDNHGGFVDQAVIVTVTGVNDAPTITAADAIGAATEDASTPNLTDTGAITFDDADLTDTHTTSVTTSAGNTLGGSLNASVTDTATGPTDGTVTWNYSVANSATQHLAEGETTTENFTVKVKDNNGGSVDQNVAVTVTGVNDAPTISAAVDTGGVTEDASTPTLSTTGTVTFDDVDLIDTHTASAAAVAGNTLGGGMTASVTDAATGAGDGTVTWNYSIANSAVQSLAAGQTVTEKFNVTVADGHGGTAVRLITITVTGTNDTPTISTAISSGSATEDATTPNLTSTGNITFDDVDLTDTHTTTVTAIAGNPLGGSLTASVTDTATGPGDGTVTWNYTVANSATQYLASGQTATDSFKVAITDNASASATQTVNASVTGVNDAPTITAADTDAQAAVTEDATTPNLSDTGAIAFNDVDLIDVHTTSVTKASGTLGGTLVMGAVSESPTTAAGTVGWTYTVANSAVQQLGKGETATETFTVTVNDGKGGTVSQLVTATVTGTNDAPVVDLNGGGAGNDATAAATEQTTLVMVPAATVTDIDSLNITSLTLTLTARPDGNAVEALSLNAAATAAASGLTVSYTAATGVLSISGSAPKATYQSILDGVQYTNTSDAPSTSARTVNVVANDGTDTSVSHSVVVSMTPVNDPPVATITPTTYAATEQVALTLKNAGLSVSDVDAASGSMTVTLSVTEGTLTAAAGGSGAVVSNSGTSSVTITGTVTQINNLLNTDATSTVSYIDGTDTPSASATLTLKVNDNGNTGGGSLTSSDTATINITATNDAPSGTDKTIAVVEDVTYTLADFGFTDADGNNFAGVVINTLPAATAGVLRLGNTAVVAGAFITAAQITDGMLIYSPVDNVFGNAGDTSFTFSVRDDGATGGLNVNQDPTPNTMTVDMSNTNFTDTSSVSNVTVQLTGANESIEDNGTGNGDSINLNTAAGGATNFTELNFFRSDNNMEMSWTQSGISRTVTALNQYGPSAYEDFNSFDDGGTFAGYNLGTAVYVLDQDFAGTASNEIYAGTAAADSINGAGGNDLLFGNGGDDTLTGGAGTDLMVGGLGNDTFVFATGDSNVTIGGSGNGGTITGNDVIADFAAGGDSLDLQGSPVAAPDGVTDGANSALTIAGNQVSSHSITNGIITFDDVGTFASALSLTSLAQVAAVVQYLRNNDIGVAGATVAFTATIGSLTHAYVYEQVSAGAAGTTANNSLLIDLVGVSPTNLTDLGLV